MSPFMGSTKHFLSRDRDFWLLDEKNKFTTVYGWRQVKVNSHGLQYSLYLSGKLILLNCNFRQERAVML